MNKLELKARAGELREEISKATAAYEAGRLSRDRYKGIVDRVKRESAEIEGGLKAVERAARYAGGAEAATGGAVSGSWGPEGDYSTADDPDEPVWTQPGLPSVFDMTDDQWGQLKWAMESRVPCRIEVKSGPAKRSWHENLRTKAAFSTASSMSGGPYAGNIPPIVSPYAVAQAFEPVRAADYMTSVPMPGPAAVWFTATNGASTGGVNELGAKPDINPSVSGASVAPMKIAGLFSFSLEAELYTEGLGEAQIQALLTHNLQNDLINQESLAFLGASTSGTNPLGAGYPVNYKFNGLLNTSGTLTRAVGTDPPFVALAKAYADIRVGSAFADPTHVWLHPNTLTALRTMRDGDGRFILDLMAGPSNLSALGQTAAPSTDREPFTMIPLGKNGYSGTLWGATVISTTHVPAGYAIVQNIPAGGAVAWHKTGLIIQTDNGLSGSNFANNAYTVRAEELISFTMPRPTSTNIVTGLPTQAS